MPRIESFDFYLLRTPRLPLNVLSNLNQISSGFDFETRLRKIYNNLTFQDAIFLASPELYREMMKWLFNASRISDTTKPDKLLLTLYKYLLRMAARATPYGLFAGVNVGTVTDKEASSIILNGKYTTNTRLDMQYVTELSYRIIKDESVKSNLKFFANKSIYQQGNLLKFYQFKGVNGKRNYYLNSIKIAPHIEFVLNAIKKGKTFAALLTEIMKEGPSKQEARHFLDQLIEMQFLISELEPNLTGEDSLAGLIRKMIELGEGHKIKSSLIKIDGILNEDEPHSCRTDKVSELMRETFLATDCRNLLQSDLVIDTNKNLLNKNIVTQIADGLAKLLPLNCAEPPTDLIHFKDRFLKHYQDRFIPLLEVLDPDTGIGYGISAVNYKMNDPILAEIQLPPSKTNKTIVRSPYRDLVFKKYLESIKNNTNEVFLIDKELAILSKEHYSEVELPPTFYALGNLLYPKGGKSVDDDFRFNLIGCGGSSCINLMSRFGHLSPSLKIKMKHCADTEQNMYSNAILAEIVHLPESRTGNILQRPYLRKYEIPLFQHTENDEVQQLSLSDLLISVKNNRIILWSESLQKEIIPKLTTAHNYKKGINIYRFLADLQYQENSLAIKWDWEDLEEEFFLPRITYKNIILSRARWIIKGDETYKKHSSNVSILIKPLLEMYKIPEKVLLEEGDNELLIDFMNPIATTIFIDKLSKGDVVLREFLFENATSPVRDVDGNKFMNELIIPLRSNSFYQGMEHHQQIQKRCSFPLGSEWVYVKVFCGVKQADQLLIQHIYLIINELRDKGLMKKWFFIRYDEDGHHVRIRILRNIDDNGSLSNIITIINNQLEPLIQAGEIYKMQYDTYERELERYTSEYIEISESYFTLDSQSVLDLMRIVPNIKYRWLLAVVGVAHTLEAANMDNTEKLLFCERIRNAFFKEFDGDKSLNYRLNELFKKNKNEMELFITYKHPIHQQLTLNRILEKRKKGFSKIFNVILNQSDKSKHTTMINKLLPSYCHMFINRIHFTDQRLQELIVYHFLSKYYRMLISKTHEPLSANK